jgi:adenylate cyclase
MAFWGAPMAIPDCEMKAVACARELHLKLDLLNARWKRAGEQPFIVCIGINSSSVVAGNIGSTRRMEYTVIGDTVNTASRIKMISKLRGAIYLSAKAPIRKVKSSFPFKPPFKTAVKGKSKEVQIYEMDI